MNKIQFLERIRAGILSLPQSDIERYSQYYSEMIDDRIEDGMTEEEAVAAMGTVDEIVAQILRERASCASSEPKASLWDKLRSKIRPWMIVVAVLTAPVWGSVIFGIASAVFGIFVAVISLYAASVGVAAGFVGCVAKGIAVLAASGAVAEGVFYFGAGLVCAGVAILIFVFAHFAAAMIVKLCKYVYSFIKSKFGGEVAKS